MCVCACVRGSSQKRTENRNEMKTKHKSIAIASKADTAVDTPMANYHKPFLDVILTISGHWRTELRMICASFIRHFRIFMIATEYRKPSASHSHRVNARRSRYYVCASACDSLDRCRFAATHFRLIADCGGMEPTSRGFRFTAIALCRPSTFRCGHSIVGHSIWHHRRRIDYSPLLCSSPIESRPTLARTTLGSMLTTKATRPIFRYSRLAIGFTALRPFNVLGDRDTWCADK